MSNSHDIKCNVCSSWYDGFQFKECPLCEDELEYARAIQEFRDEEDKKNKLKQEKIAQEIESAIDEFTLEDENSVTNLLLYCGSGNITARACAQIIIQVHERDAVI